MITRIIKAIDNWKLRRERRKNHQCPKHGVAYHYRGYYDIEYCPVCFEEDFNDKEIKFQ